MERLLASDPQFAEINRLQEMLIMIKNVRLSKLRDKGFVAGQLVDVDVADAELDAIEQSVIMALDGKLDILQIASLEEVYGEFIGGLKL